jgi:hypothetical protein
MLRVSCDTTCTIWLLKPSTTSVEPNTPPSMMTTNSIGELGHSQACNASPKAVRTGKSCHVWLRSWGSSSDHKAYRLSVECMFLISIYHQVLQHEHRSVTNNEACRPYDCSSSEATTITLMTLQTACCLTPADVTNEDNHE